MSYKERREMAHEAFSLQDYLFGVSCGGIIPPRYITKITTEDAPESSHIYVTYTYVGGCYTDLREGKSFTDEYIVDCNGNIRLVGTEELFSEYKNEECSFYDLYRPYIEQFYEKWNRYWSLKSGEEQAS